MVRVIYLVTSRYVGIYYLASVHLSVLNYVLCLPAGRQAFC
jgi:hypothetical protein